MYGRNGISAGIPGETVGGITLRYTAAHTAQVSVVQQGREAACLRLPKAEEPRTLLLPVALAAGEEVFLFPDEGIRLESRQLHPAAQVATGRNPITAMDYPDPDMIRVGDTYYMISTTMYFMPGGILLRSYDLIRWEICSRIYDVLEDTPRQRLEEGNAYGAGMWAATLRYHKGTFYVIFVANDTRKTYLYRAEAPEGPWRRSEIEGFYHDCSLLFDDDDRIYLVYGNRQIHLTELKEDLTAPKPGGLDRIVADSGESPTLGYEGSHLYKIGGRYYLFLIHSLKERWRRVETCLMSESLTGEFRGGIVMNDDMGYADAGVAQGGIVDTPDGRWFAILFQDMGAAGRIPMLMPMAWENHMPVLGLDGCIPHEICNLSTRPGYVYKPLWDSDDFISGQLKEVWEWNHIPKRELVTLGGGELRIRTGKTAESLPKVQNTLTQRALFPTCAAEVTVDASCLKDGDRIGLCALQKHWAWVGLEKADGAYCLVLRSRQKGDGEEGAVRASLPWAEPVVRLRAEMDFSPETDLVRFFYRTTEGWQPLGEAHRMFFMLEHFTGNRFGLFVQATEKPGGEGAFSAFSMEPLGK
ncbi:MAG: family 43 glycosylhydrolase [Clostridia bacterium]|nr:family 43 glycosylhydrolase [Clostridia bacterium]